MKYPTRKVYIIGDMNAKSYLWGGGRDNRTDNRGTRTSMSQNNNLQILNYPDILSTFCLILNQSWIDFVLFKNIDGNNIKNFKVIFKVIHDDILLSDHRLKM